MHPSREKPRLVNKDGVLIHRWDVFDDWLGEEFDDAELIRDEDGEVRALRDVYDEIIDPYWDAIQWDREMRGINISGEFRIPMRTLLDTSALFAALIDSHEFHHRALPWLRTVQRQEIHGIVSTHTLAELYARMSGRVRPMMTTAQVLELISRNILPFFETVSLNQK